MAEPEIIEGAAEVTVDWPRLPARHSPGRHAKQNMNNVVFALLADKGLWRPRALP